MKARNSASLVDANLRLLAAAMWDREVQPILAWHEERRASAGGSRDVSHPNEAVRVLLLEHVDESVATADVQPFPCGVVPQVSGVAVKIGGASLLSGGRVVAAVRGLPRAC